MITFFTSGTTWAFIALFLIGGLSAVGVLNPEIAATLTALVSSAGMIKHNNQIKAGAFGPRQ